MIAKVLFLAFLTCIACANGVLAIVCSEVAATTIQHSSLYADIHPLTLRVAPAINGVRQNAFLSYNFTSLAERGRGAWGFVNLSQNSTEDCIHPAGGMTDPLDASIGYGDLLQYMYTKDMDCTSTFYTDYPAPGVGRKVYRYTLTSPSMPSLVYNLTYYTVNTTYTEILSTNTTYTNGVDLVANFYPDAIKFSVDIEGWKWVDNTTNINIQSYFQMGGILGIYAPNGGALNTSSTLLAYNTYVRLPGVTMTLITDRGYMTDIATHLPSGTDDPLPLSQIPSYDMVITLNMTTAFCNQHWNLLAYDPTLAVLLVGAPSSSSNREWVPVIATFLPLFVIVGIACILLWKVPAIRVKLLPFSKRTMMMESTEQ